MSLLHIVIDSLLVPSLSRWLLRSRSCSSVRLGTFRLILSDGLFSDGLKLSNYLSLILLFECLIVKHHLWLAALLGVNDFIKILRSLSLLATRLRNSMEEVSALLLLLTKGISSEYRIT